MQKKKKITQLNKLLVSKITLSSLYNLYSTHYLYYIEKNKEFHKN